MTPASPTVSKDVWRSDYIACRGVEPLRVVVLGQRASFPDDHRGVHGATSADKEPMPVLL
jgi:hypothetical protein